MAKLGVRFPTLGFGGLPLSELPTPDGSETKKALELFLCMMRTSDVPMTWLVKWESKQSLSSSSKVKVKSNPTFPGNKESCMQYP